MMMHGSRTGVAGLLLIALCFIQTSCGAAQSPVPPDTYDSNNRAPDERFRTDVLVVVAHPDDEVMVAGYIARIVEEGKRVAMVWTTRGDGGVNDVGPEQSSAMGDIREDEGYQAATFLGVSHMWNLEGPDTPTQNPLNSLSTCDHARCLERIVRLIRLTRPRVILTWLPVAVTGENHGDHQASGILATEAFDMAGDPTTFPEQVSPASEPNQNANMLGGLRPWQPQKIYYFSNATHTEFFQGRGPQYSARDISPSRQMTYGEIAAQEFTFHKTQGGLKLQKAIKERGIAALDEPIPVMQPTRFVLGKSLVPCGVNDDVFAGTSPQGISYHPTRGYRQVPATGPQLRIGGIWDYYAQFWLAHGLDSLTNLIQPELTIAPRDRLALPLIVENPGADPIEVSFKVDAPEGFTALPLPSVLVLPHDRLFVRLQADGPAVKVPGWHQLKVMAESGGKSIGTISLRVEIGDWALPR